MNSVLLSSKDQDWATPRVLFDKLNEEFGFTIDVCAEEWNAKLSRYWSPRENALVQNWGGERCFMNPPYGREIGTWVKKAFEESKRGAVVVALIPARTDTRYFHEYIFGKAEVRFLPGRVHFERPDGVKDAAPFPSCVVVWGAD